MPSKNGTVSNLRCRFSSRACNAGAVNSSGTHGIREASHIASPSLLVLGGAVAPDQGVGRRVVGERARPTYSSGMIRLASTLPSSTPHWSNELMFHSTPCVNTVLVECDQRAEYPRRQLLERGSSRTAGCPGTRGAGRASPACPRPRPRRRSFRTRALRSARRSSRSRMSWWSPSGFRARQNPMKSHGMSDVPWWISW